MNPRGALKSLASQFDQEEVLRSWCSHNAGKVLSKPSDGHWGTGPGMGSFLMSSRSTAKVLVKGSSQSFVPGHLQGSARLFQRSRAEWPLVLSSPDSGIKVTLVLTFLASEMHKN